MTMPGEMKITVGLLSTAVRPLPSLTHRSYRWFDVVNHAKKTHYKLKYGQKERKTMLQKASRQIKSNEKLQEANKKLKEELNSIPTRLRSTVKEVIQDAENGDITGAFLLDQVRTSFMVCLATAFVYLIFCLDS